MSFIRCYLFAVLYVFFALTLSFPVFAENIRNLEVSSLPLINKLSSTDVVFKQFFQVVSYNDRLMADESKKDQVEEEFYVYTADENDDMLSVSASCNIPYDTIASLNSIGDSKTKLAGKKLVLPTVKGVFVPLKPESSVEIIICREFESDVENSKKVCYNLNNRKFYFLPGKRFTSTQRAYFLDTSIRMPLDNIQISSEFGYRTSPVYHRWKFHSGIDFASPEGTPVYACKSGTVALAAKMDPTFGNYVILSHSNGMTSVYAHLSKMCVQKGDVVHGGKVIGYTGQTGAATGPHLHFEIRQNGVATDPGKFLNY